ncbi:MAG: gliding motility-associated C-terminal domain-containing protein, partial [Saprospiraceae bacterium]|nr:gliding motility-associated C-terminal domain-containing protein [Saprospiraceae bacterium]
PNCNITLQISGTNPTCNGGSNGSINLVVSGATGGLNFDWNVNALDGQQNPTGLIAGTYSVTVTDAGGCTATRSINLTDPPALQLNVSATPETTAGVNDGTATAAATGGTGGYTFAWNNGGNTPTISGLAPGNYSVTVTDGNQCTISGSASVAAGQGGGGACVAQPVYAVAAPARVCQGDTIRLEADDLYPSPNVRYVWFIPNGDSLTTVLPRVGILAASGAYGGQYFALRDSSGCRSIRVGGAPVQVQSLPDDAATVAMLDTVLCAAGTVTLRALPALGGTGRWLPLNAATVDNAASEQTLARNLLRGPNRFVWQVSLEGCAFSAADTVTVTVEAPPVLNDDRYTLQRVQDVLVMEVLLNDNLSGLPDTVLSYLGGPAVGQLELLDGRRFRYTVTEDFRGRVSFQYVVCNPGARCGTACDTATVTIEVLNMPAVPGGLIVDDPGLNGQLTIKGLNGFSRVEMQIFSRWGDLVFEEKQYDNGNPWRGHAHRSGNALPEGAYYYVLRAFDGNVQVGEAQRGVVHLFR